MRIFIHEYKILNFQFEKTMYANYIPKRNKKQNGIPMYSERGKHAGCDPALLGSEVGVAARAGQSVGLAHQRAADRAS